MGYNKRTRYNIDRTGVLSATVLTADLLPFAECHNAYTKNEALLGTVTPEFCPGKVLNIPLIQNAEWP